MALDEVCTQCHAQGRAVKRKRGYAAVSWILAGMYLLCMVVQVGMIVTTPASLRNEPGWSTGMVGPTQFFFVAWLAHVVFRALTARPICPSCGVANAMVPASSPRGQDLLSQPGEPLAVEGSQAAAGAKEGDSPALLPSPSSISSPAGTDNRSIIAAVVGGLVIVALSAGVIEYVSSQPTASGAILPNDTGATLESNGKQISALVNPPVWDDNGVWQRIAAGEGLQEYLKAPVLCELPDGGRTADEFERRDIEEERRQKATACFGRLTKGLKNSNFAIHAIAVRGGSYDFAAHVYDLVLGPARLFDDRLWVVETSSEPVQVTGGLSLTGVRSTDWSELESPDGFHDVHLRIAMDERTARELHRRLGTFATVTVDVAFETKGFGNTEVNIHGAPVMGLLGRAIAYRIANAAGPYSAWVPFGLDKDGKSPGLQPLLTANGISSGE